MTREGREGERRGRGKQRNENRGLMVRDKAGRERLTMGVGVGWVGMSNGQKDGTTVTEEQFFKNQLQQL